VGLIGVPGQFGGRRINVIEIEVDVEAGTLTPNNDEVCDLVILQMEYIILTSELNALKRLNTATTSGPFVTMVGGALNDDVMVRNADGVTVKKGSSRMQSRASLFRFSVEEARRELDAAVKMFLNRLSANFGKLIW
jgi:soluble P-type ATPase